MKKHITLIFILFVTFSFGQKKEIKKATKLFNAGDIQGATDLLESSASLFEVADAKTLNKKTYLEAQIDQANKNFSAAFEKFTAFKAANGVNANYDNQVQLLTSDIVNSAIEDNAEKRFSEAAVKLYLAYQINPEVNKDYLYYAASSSVNATEFEISLSYYLKLKVQKLRIIRLEC